MASHSSGWGFRARVLVDILAAVVTVTVRTDLFCSLLKSFECLSI